MSEWTFKVYDLVTGTFLRDLDLRSWTSTDPLNETGPFTATFGVPEDRLEAGSLRDSTSAGRTAIVALRDGLPLYDGIVWRRVYDPNQRTVTLAGRQLGSFWDHFISPATLTYVQADQLDIWRALLNGPNFYFANANLGVVVDATVSGVLRDRTYWQFEGKRFGEAMLQLAAVNGGFDWDIRVERAGDVLTRNARLWYPRRGRVTADTQLAFRTDVNARLTAMAEDGTGLADTVTAIGDGSATDTLLSVSTGTALSAIGFPGYSKSVPYKDIKTQAALDAFAVEERKRSARVDLDNFAITVDPRFEDMPWGYWELGDDAAIVLADDPWYPRTTDGQPGLIVERRIVAHAWSWNAGAETLTLALTKSAEA